MSDFATVFYNMGGGIPEFRERRLQRNMELFGHTRAEAVIIDDAQTQGVRDAMQALGRALDSVNPQLCVTLVPLLLEAASYNMALLERDVVETVMGAQPTPDCDCPACANRKALMATLKEVEQQCKQGHVH